MKENWLIRLWQRQTMQPRSECESSVTAAVYAQPVTNTNIYVYIL